jgi:ribosomal protein S18 acetylase RimI-like enzyme
MLDCKKKIIDQGGNASLHEKDSVLPVLQDVSEASLTRAIEASLIAYQVSLAQLPGAEIYDTPSLLWVMTGLPVDFYNGVFRSILDPLHADAQIVEIVEKFRRCRLSIYWKIGPSSRPADLSQRLLTHGFRHQEDEPGMALDLLTMNEGFSAPAGLDIRLVEDTSALREWIAVWLFPVPDIIPFFHDIHTRLVQYPQAGRGNEETLPPLTPPEEKDGSTKTQNRSRDAASRFGPALPWRYYLGYLDGKPVATVLLFFGAGVAAVHWVVTLPEVRYQGIGTAMTLAALREARAAGYRVAILTASSYGERIYRRIGFRSYCTISKYSWQAPDESSSEQTNNCMQ